MSLKPPPVYDDNNGAAAERSDDDMMEIDEIEPGNDTTTSVPLVLAPLYQLPLGCRVVICNLQHSKALNGHLGIVEEYLSDQGRYKIRPLARAAKKLSKSKYVSIRPANLKRCSDSTFIVNFTMDRKTGKRQRVPFECRAFWSTGDDGNNDKQQQQEQQNDDPTTNSQAEEGTPPPQPQEQLVVQLLYSNIWDNKAQIRDQLNAQMSTCDDPQVFGIANTRIDYEEHVAEDQWLEGDEILILSHKPSYDELYDAMIDYEIMEELKDVQVYVGLNGDVPLCRLLFPYDNGAYDNDEPVDTTPANREDDENDTESRNKRRKAD